MSVSREINRSIHCYNCPTDRTVTCCHQHHLHQSNCNFENLSRIFPRCRFLGSRRTPTNIKLTIGVPLFDDTILWKSIQLVHPPIRILQEFLSEKYRSNIMTAAGTSWKARTIVLLFQKFNWIPER
jgi:hypothetical protein